MATFPCKKQMHSLEPVATGTFSLHGPSTNEFSYKPSHDRVSAVWKFACKTTSSHSHTNYPQVFPPCHKTTPGVVRCDIPWSLTGRVLNSLVKVARKHDNTMGEKVTKGKTRMYKKKKKITLAGFDPLIPNQTWLLTMVLTNGPRKTMNLMNFIIM